MKKFTNKKGFTIVELVIVIAVIAILAAVLIPTFSSVIEKANLSSAQQKARNALTVVIAETTTAEATVTNADYGFLVDEKYWFTCKVEGGNASELSPGKKQTTADTGYTKNDTLSNNADIDKLGVDVYAKAATPAT